MKLSDEQLQQLEADARAQAAPLGTPVRVMPGQLIELCRLARLGQQLETPPARGLHVDDGA